MRIAKFFFLLVVFAGWAQYTAAGSLPEVINVGIFSGENIRKFTFTPTHGRYLVCDENHDKILNIQPFASITIEVRNHSFSIHHNDSLLFTGQQIILQGASFHNSFMINPTVPGKEARFYDGDLKISASNNRFKLINTVPFESYVAGTVRWESGLNRHNVFYQVQAIIIRTYALRNIHRHQHEEFHLCDKVHCQAYYGKTNDASIINAVDQSRGEVLTDRSGNLLNTVYHANCGGQTVNSEDLWPEALPYLRSVQDTFCMDMPGARWEAQINPQELKQFLEQRFHYSPSESDWKAISRIRQNSRIHHLDPYLRVHLRHIRDAFRLRSTFFNIEHNNDTLYLKGRGYGHGVGLCQEGAIQRAAHGHSREEILKFYYKDSYIQLLEPEVIL